MRRTRRSVDLGLAIGLTAIGLFGSIYHPVGVAWLVRNAENRGFGPAANQGANQGRYPGPSPGGAS